MQIGGLETRPIRNHTSSPERAASEQRDRAGTVVRTVRAVDAGRAPNSVTIATTVSRQASSMLVSIAASAPSSAPSKLAS